MTASFSVAQKIETYMTLPSSALLTTQATYTTQNIGAGKPERVITGAKHTVILSELISIYISSHFHLCFTGNSRYQLSYGLMECTFRMGTWLYSYMGTFFQKKWKRNVG
ncbi:MAG: hypothetical protein LUE21_02120 [Oscillospiraceae bacterium]|nr:hypothetical protein [Oscillospiraceae bacterium]